MAKTLHDDEERERRIQLIGEYILETGASTRKTADYFTANYFSISNYTVSEYLKLYMKKNSQKAEELRKIIDNNTPDSIEDPKVIKRVLSVAELVESGFTIEEISKNTNIDFWTVYDDINKRLRRIDVERYKKIKEIFHNRSLSNLNDGKIK